MIKIAAAFLALLLFPTNLDVTPMKQFTDIHQVADKTCTVGKVMWIQLPTGVDKRGKVVPPDISKAAAMTTFGCLVQTEEALISIISFKNGEPEDAVMIPKGAIVDYQLYFREEKGSEDAKPAPSTAPNLKYQF